MGRAENGGSKRSAFETEPKEISEVSILLGFHFSEVLLYS